MSVVLLLSLTALSVAAYVSFKDLNSLHRRQPALLTIDFVA